MEGERKLIPVGTKVIVRKNGADGVIVRIARNGKWEEMIEHEVVYGPFKRRGWFEPFDLLVPEPNGK